MPDIPYTNTFLHDLNELCRDHEEKRISEEEYSRRIDELAERETKSHKPIEHTLLMREIRSFAKGVESEVKAEERAKRAKQRRDEQEKEQKLYQEEREKESERYNFRYGINRYINYLEGNAQNWQKGYIVLQIFLVFFSTLTATMAGIDGIPRLVVASAGFIAAIAGGFLATFKVQERIYAIRMAAAEVKLECQNYDHHLDRYKDKEADEAYIEFSGKIASIRGSQMLQEVEFWNPKKEEKKEEKNTQDNAQKDREDKEPPEKSEITSQEEKPSGNEK